ncbi:O-antigen ligase family protein [Thermoclostridium caenicola]|uniref:O-antigen ligase n=1 Tax=Thermoclostridium caenicola TaxID=659425 RepID=A0A1M6GCP9_9FIRM|nr:O-antigen ligase family protein [Thermoclostridium caenicola]SHJ07748.1 O-antigen ligase [Thermoclostridium caenicola]
MERAVVWLKESLVYRLMRSCRTIWENSLTRRMLMGLGAVVSHSRTARWLSRYFHRRFRPKQIYACRLLRSLHASLLPFRLKAADVIRESLVWRMASGSRFLRMLSRRLIPASVFFVFIDELGRSFFGASLFGVWDEVYLLACVAFLVISGIMGRAGMPVTSTPLDIPLFFLIAVSFYLYLNHSPYPHVGFEGMRGTVQFIFWYYVFSRYLDSDRKANRMTCGLIWAGGILGIHGILQYIAGVETPSNWVDAAEGTRAIRVFSVVGSPNILGSLMVLFIPIALAWSLRERTNRYRRVFCLVMLAAMGICLILTLSRGAWLGMAVALLVFCLAWNPGWLAAALPAGAVVLLIPSVYSRISYLLSPRYIMSSLTGGRLLRYKTGWEMFMANFWTGVGQGHFGGAVAMNHRDLFPNTFYMDSYWLKTAVEMGMAGLIAWFIVLSALFVWSVRAIRTTLDPDRRLVIIGGFAGMMGILVHNLFENVFEVPYMVVYFWMVAAIVFYQYDRGQFRVIKRYNLPL